MPPKGTHKCVSCGGFFDEYRSFPYGVKGWLCEGCESDDRCEPAATVLYSEDDENECPKTIGNYHDDTDGDFKVEWISTDAWRGYFKVSSDVYELIQDDCILSYSEDANELSKFDADIRTICDKMGLRYARVFTRTSNVFSAGYDFFVHKEDVGVLNGEVDGLREKYRDFGRFTRTALFGE